MSEGGADEVGQAPNPPPLAPPVKRKPGRPRKDPNAPPKVKKPPAAALAAAAAGDVDPSTVAEIPEDVLKEALGVVGRRSGRKTKARVIMIDGEPVLRSNAYTMEGGEPSVFDKELGDAEQEEGGRTSYVFETIKKRKYTKRQAPGERKKRVKTTEEEACAAHNKSIEKEIALSHQKRAAYLSRHTKALGPFVDAKALEKIKATADAYVPSEKVLVPVDNQPDSIKAVLREYQLEGIRWMTRMFDDGCSCILADEMGLGKTLQSISFLACLHEYRNVRGPHLVICPLSVLSSWMDELQKWCPKFRVVRLHSTDEAERLRLRKELVTNIGNYDVAVTTYEMACNPTFNLTLSQKVYWRTMILDEGHKVKNEETAAHSVLKRVHRQHTLLLTGTPVQNNLHELYAILAFLHPDVFTSAESFDNAFNLGTNEHKVDAGTLDHAHYLMKPFVLRRVKGEVEVSLPEKTETKIMCPLSPAQTFWYRRLLMRESGTLTAVEAANLKKHSGGGGGGEDGGGEDEGKKPAGEGQGDWRKLQSLLMQLRKCCNHPYLFSGTDVPDEGIPVDELIDASGKLAVLDRILARLKAQGHRVVLFSQFTSMLDILSDYLHLKGYQFARLDGSTNRVQRSIDIAAFNRPNSPLFAFLLSTRAGGLGVNLQTADTCILYDSDWNPQVDTQAMARVHRIGQKKPVHVYRLVTAGTVEERMQQRAEKKLFLEQMVSRGSTKQAEAMENVDKNDLYAMLRFGVDAVFANDEGKPPTDEELEILMDRSPEGDARRSELASLASEVQHTVADFAEGKAEAAPISTYMLPAQLAVEGAEGGSGAAGDIKKHASLKDIAAEFQSQILTGKRERKKTTIEIDGHTVLKANNYSLEEGEQSVYAREVKQKKQAEKRARAQVAGRDYGHSSTCQVCWDGGDIVCCDLCPASVHAECIGLTQNELAKATRWACPHHACHDCGRKAAAVGGMLFRCEACPRAFCEDHLPSTAEIIGQCKRFQALGQRHPAQACFIRCDQDCIKWAHERRLEEGGDEAEEGQAWTMGAKVALTDAWIEERDHEIDLPLDGGGGRSKPLAHATFTDLVHFLLRMEGPKRKDVKKPKPKPKDPTSTTTGPAPMLSWEEEIIHADPKPGDTIVAGGVRAYYTLGSQRLDEVAKAKNIDAKDLLAWNKPDLPALTLRAYLLEHTRLWLGPKPVDPEESDPIIVADPEEERRRREEELAGARAAAENAGISIVKDDGDGGVDDGPRILGKSLKGLRQKDLDPTEREAIMAEMFKRVRPFLERNIEKAKEREEKRRIEDEREADERRKQEQIRAERLLRRTEGIPVHLLSATASDFRSVASASHSKYAAAAPYGGIISEEQMTALQTAVLRTLSFSGARPPDGEHVTAANVKVMLARGAAPAVVTMARTRWDHPELGDALGFVLAVCALERSEKVTLKRSDKYPEAVDLAALRLSDKIVAETDIPSDSDVDAAMKAAIDDPEKGVLAAAHVPVSCGPLAGALTPGGRRGDEQVTYADENEDGKTTTVPATEFERLGGRGSTRKWRQSLRYLGDDGERGIPVGKWLREKGNSYRDAVVGRAMEILWPDDNKYYPGEVTGFKTESGEHEVMYADGNREWIYLALQTTRWPDGLPESLPPLETKPSSGGNGKAGEEGEGEDCKPKPSGKSRSKGAKGGRGARFDPSTMMCPDAPEPTAPAGPPPGEQAIEDGYKVYYTVSGETVDAASACLRVDFRDVMGWNHRRIPGLTRHAKLKADTRLWLQDPPDEIAVPKRGDGGGLMDLSPSVPTRDNTEGDGGVKRKAEDAAHLSAAVTGQMLEGMIEGAHVVAAPSVGSSKKRKSSAAGKTKPKMVEAEEDVIAEVQATCVVTAASIPIVVNSLKGRLAPGCVAGGERVLCVHPDAPNQRVLRQLDADAAGEDPIAVDQSGEGNTPSEAVVSMAEYLRLAGCGEDAMDNWRAVVLYVGDKVAGEGDGDETNQSQPRHPPTVGTWLQQCGADWGRPVIGNQLEILRADAAVAASRGERPTSGQPAGFSWRAGEVVAYDATTGEHEVTFLDSVGAAAETVRCHLFLQTMRWLPSKYEPFAGLPQPPADEGGIAYAMPPIPVGCGGMRGLLLPGGKRGEELVRYAAPRAASTPNVVAEYTVPATEFERLGGKGTAKKWRQSLRLVTPAGHKLGETMGKWLRSLGNLAGDGSIGRHIEIFWPSDNAFYGGTIAAYKSETGEHEVYYDDGGKEVLQLSMQTVRWGPLPPPGARERIQTEVAKAAATASTLSKKKSGGGGGGSASIASRAGGSVGKGGGVVGTDEWVACDKCGKWRRVPEAVVVALADDTKWQCSENPDKAFASCDVKEEAYGG